MPMSPNRRIFLNIVATYGRNVDVLRSWAGSGDDCPEQSCLTNWK